MNSLPTSRAILSLLFLVLCSPAFGVEPEWIWKGPEAKRNQSVFFRKTFELPEKPQQAHLWVAADVAVIYINGERLALHRGWEKLLYRDVASMLNQGKNLIAVEGFNGGDTDAGLLLQVSAFINGSTAAIVSDPTWKVATSVPGNWRTLSLDDSTWENSKSFGVLGQGDRASVNQESLLVAAGLKTIPEGTLKTQPEPVTPEPTPSNSAKTVVETPAEKAKATPVAKSPGQETERTSEPYRNIDHPFGDQAIPVEHINVMEGFQVERLYSVPREDQGSWVSLCMDEKGRLIASDESGSLYRMEVPEPGKTLDPKTIERIALNIGHAQGLLYAFDSLYVMVNSDSFEGRGLYRIRDTDGDDEFDLVESLRLFENEGDEHGPHSVVLGPDGASIYVCVGNGTPVVDWERTKIREVWQEDLLLDRPVGQPFMDDAQAPGGWIAKTDPEGKKWEIVATGLRNDFDAAFNRDGEMFTFDSDMEWDLGTPWYRPTRIYHVTSGAEFGWRNAGGKWPSYYFDSVPPVLEIGTGAPTGVTFGNGTKFPQKYQDALFACDWSHGRIYAVHPKPAGGSYEATSEEFLSASPLPITDIQVHLDGALYFTIGGRATQSGLYRVTYIGKESVEPVQKVASKLPRPFQLREALEQFHGHAIPGTVETAWPYLIHPDRHVRYAARTVLEHQPIETWKTKALTETHSRGKIESLLALARVGSADLQTDILDSLDAIPWANLDASERLDLTRLHLVLFSRTGPPTPSMQKHLTETWMNRFPAASVPLDTEILELLVFLEAKQVATPAMALLEKATSQEEQIGYVKSLRHLKVGWSDELRTRFLSWFLQARNFKGGASLQTYLENMRNDAVSHLSEEEKERFGALLNNDPVNLLAFGMPARRDFVKSWTVRDFERDLSQGLRSAHLDNGRRLFGEASCQECHSFGTDGRAIGPSLTELTRKYGARDILDHILNPSGQISHRYSSVVITKADQSAIIGQIVDLEGDDLIVNTDMRDPMKLTRVNRAEVAKIQPSPISMMPPGLLNSFNKFEVMDLLGYLVYGKTSETDLAQK
tara:strand:- start:6024 stop:9182 length:3159 start_codon:yes stop_codon:yes gene_type:complete